MHTMLSTAFLTGSLSSLQPVTSQSYHERRYWKLPRAGNFEILYRYSRALKFVLPHADLFKKVTSSQTEAVLRAIRLFVLVFCQAGLSLFLAFLATAWVRNDRRATKLFWVNSAALGSFILTLSAKQKRNVSPATISLHLQPTPCAFEYCILFISTVGALSFS